MNQHFVDREEELRFLERYYNKEGSSLIIIYGRRRIGKTELIKQFIKNKKHVYYLCERTSIKKNVEKFKERIAEELNIDWIKNVKVEDFETLFKIVRDILEKEKVVIVFDEFPYLIELDRGILSVFQKIWDEILSKTKTMLILCGSSIGMMENEVLGYKSPLYGRRTAQWKVKELDIKYIKEFFPNYSFEEILYVYSVVGGIPFYLLKLDKDKGFFENIREHFLWQGGFFYEEAENLLRQEFREPKNYMLILRAIADGKRKMGEIANETGLDKSAVSRYLEILQNLNLVGYELPVTASPKAKRRLYYIKDNYFNFWFRFIYPNKSRIEEGLGDLVLEDIKRSFNVYFSEVFERICRKITLKVFNFTKVGKWWYKDKEIDIVALNENTKEILFAEVKWSDNVYAKKILRELEEKSKYVQWYKEERKEYYAIFAKSFKEKIDEYKGKKVYCFDLKDLERIIMNKK